MRRRTVIAPIVLVAAALLAWRRRRARVRASLGAARVAPTPLAQPPAARLALAAPAPPPATLPTPTPPPSPPPGSRFVSVAWALVAAPADRAELTVRYAVHPPFQLDRVDAQETPTQVFVTVLLRSGATPAEAQPATSQEHEATVPLSGPLGARALIHAPADPAAPTGGEPNGPSVYP